MNRALFMIVCFVFASAFSTATNELEGTDVKPGDFKYQAAFYTLGGLHPNSLCGGAILNEWYILTSAKATHQYLEKLDKLVIYLGTTNIQDVNYKRIISEIKVQKEFNVCENHHDVALVRVKERIEFSANVQPIKLPPNGDVFDGILLSSGFNLAIEPDSRIRVQRMYKGDQLHYHNASIIPLDECAKASDKSVYRNITADFICTTNNEGFTFTIGFDGNPLVANNILYGLASLNGGSEKLPHIYTKVFAHKKWIEDNSAVTRAN